VFFAQGRDFPGQNPDELNAVCRCPGNEVVISNVCNFVYGGVVSVHSYNVTFLQLDINTPQKDIPIGTLKSIERQSGIRFN